LAGSPVILPIFPDFQDDQARNTGRNRRRLPRKAGGSNKKCARAQKKARSQIPRRFIEVLTRPIGCIVGDKYEQGAKPCGRSTDARKLMHEARKCLTGKAEFTPQTFMKWTRVSVKNDSEGATLTLLPPPPATARGSGHDVDPAQPACEVFNYVIRERAS